MSRQTSAKHVPFAGPVIGRVRAWFIMGCLGLCGAWLLGPAGGAAKADGRVSADPSLLVQGRPESGLLTLRSDYRNDPYVDANALVWMGGPLVDDRLSGDVVTVSVGLREPHGYARARLGRFILATGAVRPVHLDGAWLWGRAPMGTSAEVFSGLPVADGLEERAFDWLLGGRVSQTWLDERLRLGVSYVHQRDAGQVANEEAGVDLTVHPSSTLWLSAVSAWDVTYAGLATGEVRATWKADPWLVRAFAVRRVAARLLPATSLFSTISDSASSEVGSEGELQLFPRLDVGVVAAVQWLDGLPETARGVRLTGRGRLRLDDAGDGQVLVELSRRGGLDAGYNALYVAGEQQLGPRFRFHGSGELVAADDPGDLGQLWPWVNLGLRWDPRPGVHVAAAVIGRASPEYVSEWSALLRLGLSGIGAGGAPW